MKRVIARRGQMSFIWIQSRKSSLPKWEPHFIFFTEKQSFQPSFCGNFVLKDKNPLKFYWCAFLSIFSFLISRFLNYLSIIMKSLSDQLNLSLGLHYTVYILNQKFFILEIIHSKWRKYYSWNWIANWDSPGFHKES
jgi:hypothetical protein